MTKTMATPGCAVPGCDREAVVEVIYYDVYQLTNGRAYNVLYDRDFTCPYLCFEHFSANEAGCTRHWLCEPDEGNPLVLSGPQIMARPERSAPAGQDRSYRAGLTYPYTKRRGGGGFTIYRPLEGRSL